MSVAVGAFVVARIVVPKPVEGMSSGKVFTVEFVRATRVTSISPLAREASLGGVRLPGELALLGKTLLQLDEIALVESNYGKPAEGAKVISLSTWPQYVLGNFAGDSSWRGEGDGACALLPELRARWKRKRAAPPGIFEGERTSPSVGAGGERQSPLDERRGD